MVRTYGGGLNVEDHRVRRSEHFSPSPLSLGACLRPLSSHLPSTLTLGACLALLLPSIPSTLTLGACLRPLSSPLPPSTQPWVLA